MTAGDPRLSKAIPKRALLVDDDPDILALFVEEFSRRGWATFVASDGVHALRIMDTDRFDAILTDITMPRMGGVEFLGHAKANRLNKKARYFIISGTLDGENIKRVTSMGIASVILKPFAVQTAVDRVIEKCNQVTQTAAKATVTYDASLIKAVAAAMRDVLQFYLGEGVDVGKPYIKASQAAKGYFSAIISLNQGQAMGSVAFTCNAQFLKKLATGIFGESFTVQSEELVFDLGGELCNQISGKIKINLAKIDVYVNIGLPQIIVGDNREIVHSGKCPVIVIPMSNNEDSFCVEFAMDGSLVKGKPEGATDEPPPDLTAPLFF
jgi:CheY-like chemotaxis protein